MAFQVSPGVNVSEVDLSTVVPAVSTTEGAIAGVFKYSCDSRSCIVFQGPSFNDDNKVIKVT